MHSYPSRRYAWFVVALLTVAYAISLLDRWILTLLVEPIKGHFLLSDTQIGLLLGPVFAVFFIVAGLPLGWLADRYSRKFLIGAAMLFWCAMTAMTGVARSFSQLAFARFGVGAGEAALTPAANSLIADLFPRDQQSRAISVFSMGVSIGFGLAYLLGGQIVAWMAAHPAVNWPLVGTLESWQSVLVAVALPGVVIAFAILCLQEPRRRESQAASRQASWVVMRDYLRRHRRAYILLCVGMGASPLVGYAWQWLPTTFARVWQWPVPQFARIYGTILLIVGPLGALSAGVLSTRLYRAGRQNAPYIATMISVSGLVVAAGLVPLMPTPHLAVLLMIPATWFGAMSTSAGAAALVFMTPGDYRARASAFYIVAINAIGLPLGPLLVGLLNDHVFTAHDGVRYSLAAVPLLVGGVLALTLYFGPGRYAAAVRELEAAR